MLPIDNALMEHGVIMHFQSLLGCFNRNVPINVSVEKKNFQSLLGCFKEESPIKARVIVTLSIPFGMLHVSIYDNAKSLFDFQSLLGCFTRLGYEVAKRIETFNPFWDASSTRTSAYFPTMALSIPFGMLLSNTIKDKVLKYLLFQSLLGCFGLYRSESTNESVLSIPFGMLQRNRNRIQNMRYIRFQSLLGCFQENHVQAFHVMSVLSIPFGMLHLISVSNLNADQCFQSLLGCFVTRKRNEEKVLLIFSIPFGMLHRCRLVPV